MKGYETLKKNWEFKETFSKGRSFFNKYFVLYVRPLSTKKGQLRVAFCVGKKLGCAVRRNKIKRQMRHAFLSFENQVKREVAVIVIARGKVEEIDFSLICASLRDLCVKAKLINA